VTQLLNTTDFPVETIELPVVVTLTIKWHYTYWRSIYPNPFCIAGIGWTSYCIHFIYRI